MVRTIKQFSWVAILTAGVLNAGAFALIGPNNEAYQSPDIGYNPNPNISGQPTGPKNLGEEYRRNTPVLYYSFDQNFLDYFGSNGVVAIEKAIEVFNGLALTNLTDYSADLAEFPLEATRVNYQATALGLTDLKSTTMSVLTDQLGLTHPDRYVWTLHARELRGPGPCPADMVYSVIKRNFDPVFTAPNQLQSSSYVNGTLYTYRIVEYCTTDASPIPPMLADATEFQLDPLAGTFTAVAAGGPAPLLFSGIRFGVQAGLVQGSFYTGLTRDDVGGLRYLMRTNNINIEGAGADTETFITNTVPQLLFTSNLTDFAIAALISTPGQLNAQYPDLQIASSTPIFTNVVTTDVIFYFTNFPYDPVGSPAALVSQTVQTTNVTTYWIHEFLNVYITPEHQLVSNAQIPVVPGHSSATGLLTVLTTNISSSACGPFVPIGTICTNVSLTTETEDEVPFGDFYILPTNVCAISLVSTQLIQTISVTNETIVATNAPGTTNAANLFFSQTLIYSYDQYTYVVRPVVCPTNSVALRQGIERVRFERRDFDSLNNQFYYPVTNSYTLNAISNNVVRPQSVRRTSFVPDILFTAADLAAGPGTVGNAALAFNVPFVVANALPNLAGPGTISGPVAITYNKVGALYGHSYPGLGEDTQLQILIWGSFDGGTNAPVVYPNGTSIQDLENQVLMQVGPGGPALPDATVGVNYATQFSGFTVNGGTPPYHWTVASGALPPGLVLNPVTGAITGVATTANIYDFVLRLADAGTRFIQRPYTITVNP